MAKIVTDPNKLGGKPHIKGTDITVETLIRLMDNGMSHQDILKKYPNLSEADIAAVLTYSYNETGKSFLNPFS